MKVFDLFSKRMKRQRGDVPDVYVYDELSESLRIQIVHIWHDALGGLSEYNRPSVSNGYQFIVETLCREYGLFNLPGARQHSGRQYLTELTGYFLSVSDVERAVDIIELTFRVINRFTREFDYLHRPDASKIADSAIGELNVRFKEHGVGYQFVGGEILRVDSELVHAEVVKPALRLLNVKHFAGAQEEFLEAYAHYRSGKHKESLNDALKAFESLMKAICDKRGWNYNKNGTAKELIKTCFDNGLVPAFWEAHYASLRALLESSVPTGRNKLSGHGQGATPVEVPGHLVSYMLHMTASALVFLAEADAAMQ